jgi:hypothetical protein
MIQALIIIESGLAGLGVGIGVYVSICCLMYFAFNFGLIELADSVGIFNTFGVFRYLERYLNTIFLLQQS